jgi:hypothetical protein
MWERHESLKPTVVAGWKEQGSCESVDDVRRKLSSLSGDLGRWSAETFGSVRKEIKKLKQELDDLRSNPLRVGPCPDESNICDRLVELYHREEIMWRQRSRIDWLSHGDKNSKFFHQRASMRRRKNLIKTLVRQDGQLIDDPIEMQSMTAEFYKTLYTSEGVQDMILVLDHVPRKVTREMNEMLSSPYSPDEVKRALFQMFPTKAPGPDGFPAHFFQRH